MRTNHLTLAVLASLLCWGTANAALLSRAGGLAYYDTTSNLTWVADANLAKTSGYDADGLMTWSDAQTWIGTLGTASYLGVSDWRLPTVTDIGTPGCISFAYTGTDCGYNPNLSTGEMAYMYYAALGNTAYFNTSGNPTGCAGPPNWCLTNTGPFANLQPYLYWSGTDYWPDTSSVWDFDFSNGVQGYGSKSGNRYAWAVRRGDLAPVPVPGAAWLFGSALGLLGVVRRRVVTGGN